MEIAKRGASRPVVGTSDVDGKLGSKDSWGEETAGGIEPLLVHAVAGLDLAVVPWRVGRMSLCRMLSLAAVA